MKITRGAKGYYRWIPREAADRLDEVDADRLAERAREDLGPDPYVAGPAAGYHDPLGQRAEEELFIDVFDSRPFDYRGDATPEVSTRSASSRPSGYPTVCNAHTMWPNDPWRSEIPGCHGSIIRR